MKWQCTVHHDAWRSGVSAGGCGQPDSGKEH